MKSKTLVQCWFLLTTVLAFAFISEFMISSFQEDGKVQLHRLAPITALPVVLKEINNKKDKVIAAKKATLKYARIILTNGRSLTGVLVKEDEGWITLKVDGSNVGFPRKEIKQYDLVPAPAKRQTDG